VNLKDVVPSKNLKDNTNTITPPARQYNPAIDYFWQQMHMHPNDDSSIPHQTNPGYVKPLIPYHELTDEEKTLVHDYNFRPEDIVLLRHFNVSPGQVMDGWNFQPQGR
jgi:hypothetical protein